MLLSEQYGWLENVGGNVWSKTSVLWIGASGDSMYKYENLKT